MSRFWKLLLLKKRPLLNCESCYPKCQKVNFMSSKLNFLEYKTMQDLRKELMKTLNVNYPYMAEPKLINHSVNYMPESQSELPVRKMRDSFDTAIVPLSTNLDLRDTYTAFQGNVRIGRLMEDVDLFAGFCTAPESTFYEEAGFVIINDRKWETKKKNQLKQYRRTETNDLILATVCTNINLLFIVWCCTKHLTDPKPGKSEPSPYIIVTIRVDHIEVIKSLCQPTEDIRLSGHVCWVGNSSLEVIVWLDQENNGKWERITKALLLMAVRNPTNTGPRIVNAIEPETSEEKALFQGGEERKIKRRQMMKKSLLKTVPSEEELHLIHNIFIKTIDSNEVFLDKRILPPNSKWMNDATLSNLIICHPEHRNLHNKIFGGFLIRQALELAWIMAFFYGMKIPKLINISEIGFYSPVDVGAFLKLNASVTYTEDEFIQVFVYAESFSGSNVEGKSTTSFNFTYSLDKPCDSLYPSTYLEAMKYIDGRRHLHEFLNSSTFRKKI